MKLLMIAMGLAALLAGPTLADEPMKTAAPELAMPEPESASLVLPRSTVTEVAPMAVPESATKAASPFHRCGGGQTVYLTN